MTNTIAIIPARSGSKGVLDKNIKLLGGHPLIAYSITIAQMVHGIDRIIVSTDSEKYAMIAGNYGVDVPFLRPKEISGDNAGDYDFIKHALDWLHENDKYQPEYIVHLRPTTPLREVCYIEAAIEAIKNNNDATALRSVQEMTVSAYKTFEIEDGYMKSIYSGSFDIETANRPRQMFKKTYDPNGYVDVLKTSFICANKKIHGNKVIAYVTPRTFEVDSYEDFEYLEYILTKNPLLIQKIFK
jgi:CMP-N,N'-diacetyllegionaminic acid synthase